MTDNENSHSSFFQLLREYIQAAVVAVGLAFLIRSFVIEPYKIPSRSMVPTLIVGDHIFVNKFEYGLRIPGTKKWITKFKEPKRGDVIVFIYPKDESLDFIKRVIGLPGDTIQFKGQEIFVNGKHIETKNISIDGVDENESFLKISEESLSFIASDLHKIPNTEGFEQFQIQQETLFEKQHLIQRSMVMGGEPAAEIIVPPDHFFVMGDNRDQSADSRIWGFVPRENLKGRAFAIWLSTNNIFKGIRLERFGNKII